MLLILRRTSGLRLRQSLNHLLPMMLTGLQTLSQTATAVMEAARRAGKAVGVAKVSGEGAGNVAPWNGGLSLQMVGLQLVGVRAAGTGMMMTPASGRFYATRNGWPQLLLHRMLLPLGLVRRLRGSTCSLALVTVNKNPCFPGQSVSP